MLLALSFLVSHPYSRGVYTLCDGQGYHRPAGPQLLPFMCMGHVLPHYR